MEYLPHMSHNTYLLHHLFLMFYFVCMRLHLTSSQSGSCSALSQDSVNEFENHVFCTVHEDLTCIPFTSDIPRAPAEPTAVHVETQQIQPMNECHVITRVITSWKPPQQASVQDLEGFYLHYLHEKNDHMCVYINTTGTDWHQSWLTSVSFSYEFNVTSDGMVHLSSMPWQPSPYPRPTVTRQYTAYQSQRCSHQEVSPASWTTNIEILRNCSNLTMTFQLPGVKVNFTFPRYNVKMLRIIKGTYSPEPVFDEIISTTKGEMELTSNWTIEATGTFVIWVRPMNTFGDHESHVTCVCYDQRNICQDYCMTSQSRMFNLSACNLPRVGELSSTSVNMSHTPTAAHTHIRWFILCSVSLLGLLIGVPILAWYLCAHLPNVKSRKVNKEQHPAPHTAPHTDCITQERFIPPRRDIDIPIHVQLELMLNNDAGSST